MNKDQLRVKTRNYNADHWEGPVIQLNKIGIQKATEEIKQYEYALIRNIENLLVKTETNVIKGLNCAFEKV